MLKIMQGIKDNSYGFTKFNLPDRIVGPLEEQLREEYEQKQLKWVESFPDFLKRRLKEMNESGEIEQEGEKTGDKLGAGLNKGLDKQVKKFDSVLYGSAEHLRRIAEATAAYGAAPRQSVVGLADKYKEGINAAGAGGDWMDPKFKKPEFDSGGGGWNDGQNGWKVVRFYFDNEGQEQVETVQTNISRQEAEGIAKIVEERVGGKAKVVPQNSQPTPRRRNIAVAGDQDVRPDINPETGYARNPNNDWDTSRNWFGDWLDHTPSRMDIARIGTGNEQEDAEYDGRPRQKAVKTDDLRKAEVIDPQTETILREMLKAMNKVADILEDEAQKHPEILKGADLEF
jgi:hypothetical protein